MVERGDLIKKAGEELRKLRLNTGLSVFKVAKAIHISGNYLSEIERGEKEPSDIVLDSLASFYKVDNSDIFALYNRVAPSEALFLTNNTSLRKTLTQIATDKRITDEERESVFSELNVLYQKLLENK